MDHHVAEENDELDFDDDEAPAKSTATKPKPAGGKIGASAPSRSASSAPRPDASHAPPSSAGDVDAKSHVVTIDVRAVHDFIQSKAMFFAYTYPIFGQDPTVSAPVQVQAKQESPLGDGWATSFPVSLSRQQLSPVFGKDPLIIELMGTDQSEVGIVKINLQTLLTAQPQVGLRVGHAWGCCCCCTRGLVRSVACNGGLFLTTPILDWKPREICP